jgi:nitric oxide reductase large subunit
MNIFHINLFIFFIILGFIGFGVYLLEFCEGVGHLLVILGQYGVEEMGEVFVGFLEKAGTVFLGEDFWE